MPRLRARAAQTGAPVSMKRTVGKAANVPASSRPTTMISSGVSVCAARAANARASVGALRLGMMMATFMARASPGKSESPTGPNRTVG